MKRAALASKSLAGLYKVARRDKSHERHERFLLPETLIFLPYLAGLRLRGGESRPGGGIEKGNGMNNRPAGTRFETDQSPFKKENQQWPETALLSIQWS
jgi:hypothetical protein